MIPLSALDRPVTTDETSALPAPSIVRRGRWLEYFTLGWNALEASVGIGAGMFAGSTALIGFGSESLIEALSGAALLWRLHEGDKGARRERGALKLVGASFLVLAAYVAWESAQSLIHGEAPAVSYAGIVLAVACAIVMPLLARAKRNVAARLESRAMEADSRQSAICGYLSVILLVGLGANALAGWWWADPVAGLLMVPIIAKEGVEAVRGRTCSCQA